MRNFAYVAVVLVATAFFVRRGLAGREGDFTAPRDGAIEAAGATLLKVESGAGELRVVGVDGASQVRVRGTAHATRERGLDGVRLELQREGNEIHVRSSIAKARRGWFLGPVRRSLDLVVEVPRSMEAEVTDASGDAEVQGVSALSVTDASGELRVIDVRGPVRVTDGSGDLELSGVHGDLLLTDGSGDVTMRNVMGSVVVEADGSGGIEASDVRGSVLVRADGSGDIDVSNVGGRFIVSEDGSGDVRYHDVRGPVDVPPRKAKHAAHPR